MKQETTIALEDSFAESISLTKRRRKQRHLLTYPVSSTGFVDHWLVAGPQAIPVTDLSRYDEQHPRPGILRDYHHSSLLVGKEPVEGEVLTISDGRIPAALPWKTKHCGADHFADFTTFGFTCHYLCTWAFAGLYTPIALPGAKVILTVNGPADVWVNGDYVQSCAAYHYQIPGRVEFLIDLKAGENAIVIACAVIAIRECPYAFALQLPQAGNPETMEVRLRTIFTPEERSTVETALESATLNQTLYQGKDMIYLQWSEQALNCDIPVRVRMETQPVIGLGREQVQPEVVWKTEVQPRDGTTLSPGPAQLYSAGKYTLVLEPAKASYPASRRIPLRIVRGEFSTKPYGSRVKRAVEALQVAATRETHLYGEIARMALGRWDELRTERWREALDQLRIRSDCGDFFLVGMLGALHRYGENARFPSDLHAAITDGALNYRYWLDEPGNDAMCFHTENHQILFHTCEILAGQLFPDKVFSNCGENGSWHARKGAVLAKDWLRKRALGGFQEWDSNVYFEHDVLALSHLADLAADPEVSTLATIVLDKVFLQMALNSFRGVFGSTHGRAYTELIKGGRLELTSGISRILWGAGSFNDNILGTVSLACAQRYQLPEVIADIAVDNRQPIWNRERHGGTFAQGIDCREGVWEVNKVTYRTADYMLCSAQDLAPGSAGNQQHVWQATFGPDAVVFTTHPVCLAEDGYHRPNFWHGNGRLPRVAQWKNVLIALYNLPEDDWMGFTHAYFPTAHFDEFVLLENWIFGRKDEGYIALYASQGISLVADAKGTQEELRSHGHQCVWICQMGSASENGSFHDFRKTVLDTAVETTGLFVRTTTPRGDRIEFSWKGDLVINGQPEKISGFLHYENCFCTRAIDSDITRIETEQYWLEWDVARTARTMGKRSPVQ